MGPLMNQLMMVQSLNYTLMSFGHIIQSMGINASSILQFGQNILRTLDSLAIAIKKSGILKARSEDEENSLTERQQVNGQKIKQRRRAVLFRWSLVFLTMAVTSQVLRLFRAFSNSNLPWTFLQQVITFFRSFVPTKTLTSNSSV